MASIKNYRSRCPKCGREFSSSYKLFRCPYCKEPLELVLDTSNISLNWSKLKERKPGVWRYKELLPEPPNSQDIVTLGEGATPLVRLENNTYIKLEGSNPTGSFKDRGMTVAISIARSLGYRAVAAASTGNTAASAAAYAAYAGLKCYIIVPRAGIARGKLLQVLLHGAELIEINGSFDNALRKLLDNERNLLEKGIYPVNSFNPWRLEGQKTIAYELYEALGSIDAVIVPVGNAGNIYAIWKGFKELVELGLLDQTPRMIGVQAEGAAPLYKAWSKRLDKLPVVSRPATIASAIRIGSPVNWLKALKAVRESKGIITVVSDNNILVAQRDLGRRGFEVEPASAASYAAYKALIEESVIDKKDKIVLIATGHALKDPESLEKLADNTLLTPKTLNLT